MFIEVGIYARDGDALQTTIADSRGEPRREARLCSQYVFELRKPSGALIRADGEWWLKFKDQIIDTLSERVLGLRIEDDVLPLPTQYMAYWPYNGETANGQGVLRNEYIIKCVQCDNGMSEMGVRGLCSDCNKG